MMFTDASEIAARAKALEGLDTMEAQLFGVEICYYVLIGEKHVTGLPARVIGLRQGQDKDGPFHVDLVIDTPVDNVFFMVENELVDSMRTEHRNTGEIQMPGCCKVEHLAKVIEIVNAPRFSDGLRLVK